jgi:hypothetical protein
MRGPGLADGCGVAAGGIGEVDDVSVHLLVEALTPDGVPPGASHVQPGSYLVRAGGMRLRGDNGLSGGWARSALVPNARAPGFLGSACGIARGELVTILIVGAHGVLGIAAVPGWPWPIRRLRPDRRYARAGLRRRARHDRTGRRVSFRPLPPEGKGLIMANGEVAGRQPPRWTGRQRPMAWPGNPRLMG